MRRGTKYHRQLIKSEEAMLAAVSIYNNPLITFKTEACIELVVTAWIYLMQAYCEHNHIEVRQKETGTARVRYKKSSLDGSYLTIGFDELLTRCGKIIDEPMRKNLEYINGLRCRIQHSVNNSIDGFAAPKIQANVLNFDKVMREISDGKIALSQKLPLALQLAQLSVDQAAHLIANKELAPELQTFILDFEDSLPTTILESQTYEARVKLVVDNKERGKNLLSMAVSKLGEGISGNASTVVLKEVERRKYRPSDVVKLMNNEGFSSLTISKHSEIWQLLDGKNPEKGFGVKVSGQWYWYQKWVDEVIRPVCERFKDRWPSKLQKKDFE